MKKLASILLCLTLFVCCKKDNSNSGSNSQSQFGINQLIVTKGNCNCGFNSDTINLLPGFLNKVGGIYTDTSNSTLILLSSSPANALITGNYIASMDIEFLGKGIGKHLALSNDTTNNDTTLIIIEGYFKAIKGNNSTLCDGLIVSDSIRINITRYDAIGGLIEGTFSGRLSSSNTAYDSNGNPFFPTLNCYCKFSVIRGANQ